jgi:hypothetical protein
MLISMVNEQSGGEGAGSFPYLGYFVLDVLQYDTEQMNSILGMLNARSDMGWRDSTDRDFTAPEVREVLHYLAGGGLLIPYADLGGEQLVPIDGESAKRMSDGHLWWLLSAEGEKVLDEWWDLRAPE